MTENSLRWFCVSATSCSVGLYAAVVHVLPILQFIAVTVTIIAGVKSLLGRK